MPPGFEYDIDDLYQEAKKRWLKPVEVLYILRNHDKCEFTNMPPNQPRSGSLFLYNRRVLRFFRKDGHNWRKKRDGRTVREAHERLKVGNVEILNCYYAHGEENRTFQRRSYWMLDPAYEHIVLVHYRETDEGKSSSEPVTQLSPGSSSVFSEGHRSYATQNRGTVSIFVGSSEPNQNFSSPGSVEVTSDVFVQNNEMDHLDGTDLQAFRQLEEHLSLDEDNFKEISSFYVEHEIAHGLNPQQDQRVTYNQDKSAVLSRLDDPGQPCDEYNGGKDLSWTEMLESCKAPLSLTKLPEQQAYEASRNEKSPSSSGRVLTANQENGHWLYSNSNNAVNCMTVFNLNNLGIPF